MTMKILDTRTWLYPKNKNDVTLFEAVDWTIYGHDGDPEIQLRNIREYLAALTRQLLENGHINKDDIQELIAPRFKIKRDVNG
jgi:hypothetical protein